MLLCVYMNLKIGPSLIISDHFWSCAHRISLIRGGDYVLLFGRQVPVALTSVFSAPWHFQMLSDAQKPQW